MLQSLADRIKIARDAKGVDINLSVQYILNCGGGMAGSCHGGSHSGVYQFIKHVCLLYATLHCWSAIDLRASYQ
jgi:cathepsin X